MTRRGENTRELLIDTALELFSSDGYEATSTARVLDASGVSKGSLYHHFEDKEALFLAVLERVEDQLVDAIQAAAQEAKTPQEALRAGGIGFLEQAADGAVRQIALLDAPAALGWRRWREVEERYGLGLIKRTLHLARPRAPESAIEYGGHVLLATLIELGLLVAHADDARAALKRATGVYGGVADAVLAQASQRSR